MSKNAVDRLGIGSLVLSAMLGPVSAGETLVTEIHRVTPDGVAVSIGTVAVSASPYGTLFTPELAGLTPGLHGFHVHQNPDCGPGEKAGKTVAGLAAGGHYDPQAVGRHEGPYGNGHLGDLPGLFVDDNGNATVPLLAPRMKLDDVKGRALVIHAEGDNYSDEPRKLGGGGARLACGVID